MITEFDLFAIIRSIRFVLQLAGGFLIHAKPLERFCLRNAILVKALVFVEFINHLLEFLPIDDPTDDIGCAPPTGLIKVAVIEHIALLEVVSC